MAIKLSEPIGNSLYAPLFLRCAIGSYFILAGLGKLEDVHAFVSEVEKFNILPGHLATVYGILLPYVEIAAGFLVLIGLWTTLASFVLSALLASFILALGIFPSTSNIFNKDIILLAGSLSILYSGSGAFSIDRFRKSG